MHIPLERYFERDTAEVDWCEHNYVWSDSIAEFYNSLTGCLLIIYPALMILLSRHYTRFFTSYSVGAWLIHVIIGVASVYYHATLSLAGQLLDEIAILWVLVYTLAVWLPLRYYDKHMKKGIFQVWCLAGGVLITILSTLSPVLNAFCLLILGLPFAWIILRDVKRNNLPESNKMCRRVMFFWILGMIMWANDRGLCSFWRSMSFPYFHALWHVCISIVGHEVCIIGMYFHAVEQWQDLRTEIVYWPQGFPRHLSFPYVKMTPRVKNDNKNGNIATHTTSLHMQNGHSSTKSGMVKRF